MNGVRRLLRINSLRPAPRSLGREYRPYTEAIRSESTRTELFHSRRHPQLYSGAGLIMPVAVITQQTRMASGFFEAHLYTILSMVNRDLHPNRAGG